MSLKRITLRNVDFAEAFIRVDLPKRTTRLGDYSLFISGKGESLSHSLEVPLLCGICVDPAEGIPVPRYSISQAGLKFIEQEEGSAGRLTNTCQVDDAQARNCRIITNLPNDPYGLYNDEPNTSQALNACAHNPSACATVDPGNCTVGIGIVVRFSPCTADDLD